MYSEHELVKLKSIKDKIDTIYLIVDRHKGIVNALKDIEGQPAILMLLVAIAEQFNKLDKKQSKLLEQFNKTDIKGIFSTKSSIIIYFFKS